MSSQLPPSLNKPVPPPPQSSDPQTQPLTNGHPPRLDSGLIPDMDQRRDSSNGRGHNDAVSVYQPNQQPRELFLRVRIHSIEKAKKDLMVRFDAITNLPHFRASSYPGIVRPYRELCLYSLALSLSSPATIVPALPLPSTTASGLEDTRILRLMLSRWFSRILAEPNLRDHLETRNLIEADFAYSPTPPGAGSSAAARKRFSNAMSSAASVAYGGVDSTGGLPNGVLATSASAGSRISSGGLGILGFGGSSKVLATSRSIYDDDEDLVAARAEVTRLEMQFADAAEASEKLAHARRSLTAALSDLCIKLNNLGAVEEVRPASARLGLPYALKRSAHMVRSVGELQDALSNTELLTIGDAVAYQSINARAAKEAMLSRNALVEEHHNAQKATVAKKRDAEHLKMQRNLRADRVDDALEELEEAKRHELALAQNLKKISAELHGSLQNHSRYAHQDLQQALIEHARGSVMYSRQMLKEMKALKADLEGEPNRNPVHSWSSSPSPMMRPSLSMSRNSSDASHGPRQQAAPQSSGLDTQASPSRQPSTSTSVEADTTKTAQQPASPGHLPTAPSQFQSQPTTAPIPNMSRSTSSTNTASHHTSPTSAKYSGPVTPSRPNPWAPAPPTATNGGSMNSNPDMTQSVISPSNSNAPAPESPFSHGMSGAGGAAQSTFLDQRPPMRPPSNPFGTLNSGTGTASGRSRISAAEAARSLAGKF